MNFCKVSANKKVKKKKKLNFLLYHNENWELRIIKLKEEFDFYVSQASSFFSFFSSIYPRAYMKRDNDNETNTELDTYINHKISIQKKHASKWRNINDSQVSDSAWENEEKNVSRDFPKLKRNFQYDSNQI